MNARALIELKKALNYTGIGICLGICICLTIHFCVSQCMAKMQDAERNNAQEKAFNALMDSLPKTPCFEGWPKPSE